MWTKKRQLANPEAYASIVEGLKEIYAKKVRPLEKMYSYDFFYSPLLKDADFDAKPTVLLLGQYSTGKTTFIRYLLERDFPGQRISPEPTTDKFMAIYYGKEEMVIPGNALAVDAEKPYRGLDKFGMDFLNRFQGSEVPAPILEDITFVDTPGVLSGEKQRIGRSYEFVSVVEWFASRSDMILLLFDAHKLDISDEFKRVIEALRGHEDKVRVILNKADTITGQQLMRVYGALLWSLGKVLKTPEVVRVYTGSFWNQPYQNESFRQLFEAEQEDLLKDLYGLPKNSAVRKVNELVKRARLARVHAYIVSYLKANMPFFRKAKKQNKLLEELNKVFNEVQKKYNLPIGDFPPIEIFKEKLKQYEFDKFPKLDQKKLDAMDQVLSEDLPKLLKLYPHEMQSADRAFVVNSNPFNEKEIIPDAIREKAVNTFNSVNPYNGKLPGAEARRLLLKSCLPRETLGKIWDLADRDKDGELNQEEFVIATWLVDQSLAGNVVPDMLPSELQMKSKVPQKAPTPSNNHLPISANYLSSPK